MKNKARKIMSILLTFALLISVVPFAFADSTDEASEMRHLIDEINEEYGTHLRILTDEEIEAYGFDLELLASMENESRVEDVESALRDIVEVMIPQIELATEYSISQNDELELADGSLYTTPGDSSASTNPNRMTVYTDIQYASAGITATLTLNSVGEKMWTDLSSTGLCLPNIYNENWFLATVMSTSYASAQRVVKWVGTGDYCSYINGVMIYVSSGTQTAYFRASDYTYTIIE